ncbi:MAG: hypothetical protein IT212_07495 [Bacteroidia bacterium]|nr:hypothetical protein [Bacteroidia bacterium]
MNPKTISRSIIAIVIGILILWALQWHNDNVKDRIEEAIATQQGQILSLKKQLKADSIEGVRLKHIADSVINAIRYSDTIIIRKRYEVKINNVRLLNADSSIKLLGSNLSK